MLYRVRGFDRDPHPEAESGLLEVSGEHGDSSLCRCIRVRQRQDLQFHPASLRRNHVALFFFLFDHFFFQKMFVFQKKTLAYPLFRVFYTLLRAIESF